MYSDPTLPPDGFEGFALTEGIPNIPRPSVGFEGFALTEGVRGVPRPSVGFEGFALTEGVPGFMRPALGFEGFVVVYAVTNRFILVTDFRGTPLVGAIVTVQNTSGNYVQITDALGIAAVVVDVAGTKNVQIQKDKTNLSSTFTFSTDPVTKSIVVQPRLL